MEEAYGELYQQFLQLRSLCLRQAALLRQLTQIFQKQKSPDGELPVEIPEQLPEKPGPASRKLTAAGGLPKNMDTFSDLLALDMSKLTVHGGCQSNETQESVQNVPPLQSLESSRWPGGSGDSRPALRTRAPPPNMADSFASQVDGILMSDVALQSHTCDFCQAVFPGDTSTRGEFLRHLYTHIT